MSALPPTVGYATQPRYGLITAIELGLQTTITFESDHPFLIGQNVGIRVPRQYGTEELNNKIAHIVEVTDDTITFDIDSTNFTQFVYPVAEPSALAMIVPSSSGVDSRFYTPFYILDDAFTNIRT